MRELHTLVWVPAIGIGAVAIAIFLWRLTVDVAPVALSAKSTLAEIGEMSSARFVDDDPASLQSLSHELAAIESEVSPALTFMGVVGRFSPATAWLPALSREVAAWGSQAQRIASDFELANMLVSQSSQLFESYDGAQTVLLAAGERKPIAQLTAQARDLESSFATSLDRLTDTVKSSRKQTPALRPPGVRDAMARMAEAEAQMLKGFRIARQASGLLADLLTVGEEAQPLVRRFVGNGAEPGALDAQGLKSTLGELDQRLQFALVTASGLADLVIDAGQSPQLSDRLADLQKVLDVLLTVSRATMVGLEAVGPSIGDAQGSGPGLLSNGGHLSRTFEAISSHQAEISAAVGQLEESERALRGLNAGGELTRQFRGLEDLRAVVSMLRGGLKLALDLAPVGADLVGVHTTRRYLVLGQSVDELRATGGFVSSIWVITFENGALTDVRYFDAVRVDDWERLDLYPRAPAGLEEHMNARVWLLRDVSWEPDFPTTARTAADMFKVGQRQDVDGVAAIDQWALLALVESLGSIPTPDGGPPITPHNLLSKLEQETDQHGRAYSDLIFQGVLERLNEPLDLSTLMKLASALQGSFLDHDLLLFLEDKESQAVVEANGWDARVRDDPTDYLYVIDSNVGWSKGDRNIERKVNYVVDLRKQARPRITLTLAYNNHSGPGSPGCEPQWLNRGTNYSQLKNACYWNFWRAYVPQGARLLSNTPLPLPEYSVSAAIGRGVPGDDTVKVSSSYNRTVFSGLFSLEAGRSGDVSLVYELPPEVITRDGDEIVYRLVIQKQPGIRQRQVHVEFLLPQGFTLTASSIAPSYSGDSRVGFFLSIRRDTLLDARFGESGDGPR